MGNTHLLLDKIVFELVSGWSIRDSEACQESLKSASTIRQKIILLVTFAYATEGGEGVARALLDVKHIASNEFCDLTGLGCILYLDLTYVWR